MRPLRCHPMPALGEEFRSAREARGLTLSDVSEQIHIRSAYLNAIENEDWAQIGAPVYVRGFLRTYARFLGIDGESAVQRFSEMVPPDRAAAVVTTADDDGTGPSVWAILGILVAVLLVAFAGYEWWQYSSGSSRSAVASATNAPASPVPDSPQPSPASHGSGSPSPAPSATASPAAAGSGNGLEVRLTQRSWLRVVVDGSTAIEGLFPAGTVKTFTGHSVDVRAGNAGGVVISVKGASPATLGNAGDVVEQHYAL